MTRRVTVSIDEELLDAVRRKSGDRDLSSLVSDGLRRIVRRDGAERLAELGGTMPDLQVPDRGRLQ